MARRALVTGASGFVGARLAETLRRGGEDVVVASRRPESLAPMGWGDGVRTVALDVTDDAACATALADAGPLDVAYYLVHALGTGGFAETDRDAARRFGAAAREAGVGRIVYLGGFVPDGETLSEHLDSRAEVGEELQRSGVDTVWLRASAVIGAGSTPYELIRHLVGTLAVLPVPAWMDHRVQPIAASDLLHYLLAVADPSVPAGAYDVAGEESMPYTRLIETFADVAGLRRRLVRVPGVTPGLAAPTVARLTPVPTSLVEDLVLSLANSMQSSESRIRSLVDDPDGGLLTVRESLRRARGDDEPPPTLVQAHDLMAPVASDPDWARGGTGPLARLGALRSLVTG